MLSELAGGDNSENKNDISNIQNSPTFKKTQVSLLKVDSS